MSIPKLKQQSRKAEAFTAEAPDAKREYKLRGRKQPLALNLPPDLIAQVDVVAGQEERSRSKMIEMLIKVGLQHWSARGSSMIDVEGLRVGQWLVQETCDDDGAVVGIALVAKLDAGHGLVLRCRDLGSAIACLLRPTERGGTEIPPEEVGMSDFKEWLAAAMPPEAV